MGTQSAPLRSSRGSSEHDQAAAKQRLAAAFGIPVLVEPPPVAIPDPGRLRSAPRATRGRPWLALAAVVAVLLVVALVVTARSRPTPVAELAGRPGALAADALGADSRDSSSERSVAGGPGGTGTSGGGAAAASASGGGGAVVVIDVAGSVARPGVVSLPVGARVAQAIDAAGGLLPGASTAGLNLARRLNDGEQVLVGMSQAPPAPGAVAAPGASVPGGTAPGASASSAAGGGAAAQTGAGSPVAAGAQIDLNSATGEQLEELPRIGPATAARIIAHRTENGPFTSVDQLLDVPGIGERTLEGLREKVRV